MSSTMDPEAPTTEAESLPTAPLPRFDLLPYLGDPPEADADVGPVERAQIRLTHVGGAVAVVREGDARAVMGDNVTLDLDRVTLLSKVDGRVAVVGGKVCVVAALEVPGNVDSSTGNVDVGGDVFVRGNILDLMRVVGTGSVFVDGAVEGADVRAANDLRVGGGIIAKDRGSCVVGGSVHAKTIANAKVEAGRDIVCRELLIHSTIACGGSLTVSEGAIVGGKISAACGVNCRTLGAESGVMTVIEAGVDAAFRRDLPKFITEIEANRQKARKIEQTVQPLLTNQAGLTPAQKGKASELLREAQEMSLRADNLVKHLKTRYGALVEKGRAEVAVSDVLYHGVVIRFPGLQTRIMTAFKGPLKVRLIRVEPDWRIQLFDPNNQFTQYLGGESVPDGVTSTLARLV